MPFSGRVYDFVQDLKADIQVSHLSLKEHRSSKLLAAGGFCPGTSFACQSGMGFAGAAAIEGTEDGTGLIPRLCLVRWYYSGPRKRDLCKELLRRNP